MHAAAMAPTPTAADWNALVVAALTLTIVLVVGYMCVLLFKLRAGGPVPPRDSFAAARRYRPACAGGRGASGAWRDPGCARGLTSGAMPSVDDDAWYRLSLRTPCAGALGVPPPPPF
jgi:hypothetical protein